MRRWMAAVVAGAALAALPACKTEVICPSNQTACGESCRAFQTDPRNCGGCGNTCPAAEVCQAGACTTCALGCHSARGCQAGLCLPDLEVACFASGEVQGLAGDLSATGPATKVDRGPVSLAPLGGRTWVANSLTPSVVGVDLAGGRTGSAVLAGSDIEMIRAYGGAYARADGLLFVSNDTSHSLVVIDPVAAASGSGHAVVDEVDLHRAAGKGEYPHGIAFLGARAFVALYGGAAQAEGDYAHGQAVAVVSLPSTACSAPPCAGVAKVISLSGVTGAADAPGLPFPSGAVAVGSRVYLTLANLKLGGFGYFTDPAGDGKLLVIDAGNADALSVVPLPGCTNPGAIAAAGTRLWIACGGSANVLPVDISATPAPGTAVAVGVTSGGIAICGSAGYVTDQYSGDVVRFDPAGTLPLLKMPGVCPVYPPPPATGFAWAADVACAP